MSIHGVSQNVSAADVNESLVIQKMKEKDKKQKKNKKNAKAVWR